MAFSLRTLSPQLALFYWRAHRHARRSEDRFSLASAARPVELARLLDLARGRTRVVELGTGTAWSTVALCIDDPARRVISYDPSVRVEREACLSLGGDSVRARIELRAQPDTDGPRADDHAVQMLFIDSAHERDAVNAAFHAWRDALEPGAVVAFHDYGHPDHPGVRDAVEDLGLSGQEIGGLFVWRAP